MESNQDKYTAVFGVISDYCDALTTCNKLLATFDEALINFDLATQSSLRDELTMAYEIQADLQSNLLPLMADLEISQDEFLSHLELYAAQQGDRENIEVVRQFRSLITTYGVLLAKTKDRHQATHSFVEKTVSALNGEDEEPKKKSVGFGYQRKLGGRKK